MPSSDAFSSTGSCSAGSSVVDSSSVRAQTGIEFLGLMSFQNELHRFFLSVITLVLEVQHTLFGIKVPFTLVFELRSQTCKFPGVQYLDWQAVIPQLKLLWASSIFKLKIVQASVKWPCSRWEMEGMVVNKEAIMASQLNIHDKPKNAWNPIGLGLTKQELFKFLGFQPRACQALNTSTSVKGPKCAVVVYCHRRLLSGYTETKYVSKFFHVSSPHWPRASSIQRGKLISRQHSTISVTQDSNNCFPGLANLLWTKLRSKDLREGRYTARFGFFNLFYLLCNDTLESLLPPCF